MCYFCFVTAESANNYINDLINKNKADNIVKIYSLPAKYVVPGGTPIEDRYKETHTIINPITLLMVTFPKIINYSVIRTNTPK